MGMGVPMVFGTPVGFPQEWELDLNKDGNGNGNKTTWEWEWLMLAGFQNHSRGLVESHYTTLCAPVCGFRTKAQSRVIYFCLL